MNNIKARNPAMDIVRCFALFCVISVHFFAHIRFYYQPVIGNEMYILTLMRSFFMICVPLFLLLTGYLNCNKKLTKGYYLKISRTIGIYLLASVACIIYRLAVNHEDISLVYLIGGFFGYKNAPYAWYIEMYIGLFLLTPFLNVLYNNLDSKRKKQALVLTFIILTALPSIINIYRPDLNWFLNPSSSSEYGPIIPDWWINIYPLTYYFLGCYLREYKLNIRIRYQALLLLLVIIANGSFNFYRSYNTTFIQGEWQQYYGITQVIQAVLVFSIIARINYSKFPAALTKFIGKISGLCLGGYLISWIFDSYIYKILNTNIPKATDRLPYFLITVPIVFICSIIASFILNKIYDIAEKIVVKTYHSIRK